MFTTIGELANGIIEYANVIEMSIVNNTPFIRALLGSGNGFAKAYVYIVQIKEHRYAVCDSYDDVCGNRYFPTGLISKPFIQEKEIVQMKYSSKSTTCGDYSNVVSDLDPNGFFKHLLHILYKYDIIKIGPSTLSIPLSHVFENGKIKRNIEASFHDKKGSGSIEDLINIVARDRNSFNLGNLKQKEVKEVISKLKAVGIILEVSGNDITQVTLERKR